ncbi:hypothetical protein [Acuticoccus mangrovi]|uniref:Secreted protein n=1 Tax=Acuticoccus mangrovi TaxID=2796142 RepID=A0A934IIP0_9HYPH|nr:hypothetical protein [Acuticoccus mangrovi]MBJ3775711.1 hypothetical protein [Acuticoccus mangrovi]
MMRMLIVAGVAIGGAFAAVAPAAAGDDFHSGRTVYYAAHAPRPGGPNEDSYQITQDDRRTVACYEGTYYPAKYRVDPQGRYLSGASKSMSVSGNSYRVTRKPAVYVETRTRVKEDYVSLRPVACD